MATDIRECTRELPLEIELLANCIRDIIQRARYLSGINTDMDIDTTINRNTDANTDTNTYMDIYIYIYIYIEKEM